MLVPFSLQVSSPSTGPFTLPGPWEYLMAPSPYWPLPFGGPSSLLGLLCPPYLPWCALIYSPHLLPIFLIPLSPHLLSFFSIPVSTTTPTCCLTFTSPSLSSSHFSFPAPHKTSLHPYFSQLTCCRTLLSSTYLSSTSHLLFTKHSLIHQPFTTTTHSLTQPPSLSTTLHPLELPTCLSPDTNAHPLPVHHSLTHSLTHPHIYTSSPCIIHSLILPPLP